MLTFTCEEEKQHRQDMKTNLTASVLTGSVLVQNNTSMDESAMLNESSLKQTLMVNDTKDFYIIYVFERQMQNYWQKILEQKLEVYKTIEVKHKIVDDCFQ